jgi:hypothetical protein
VITAQPIDQLAHRYGHALLDMIAMSYRSARRTAEQRLEAFLLDEQDGPAIAGPSVG